MNMGVQLALYFSQSQDKIWALIFSNISPVAIGHKGLLQGTYINSQVVYAALQLGIQIPEQIFFFPHIYQ